MLYHFQFQYEDDGWYVGEGIELTGCISQGKTIEELTANLKEAAEGFLMSKTDFFPPADKSIKMQKNIIGIHVDPKMAMSNYLRWLRNEKKLTQTEIAEKMGYSNINAYQKLERGKHSITLNTIEKIKKVFPELDLNFVFE
jgi:predicted RNase H-like HicB family nuclease/DNA-binding XRE family transcriptional regulator